jgi:hypothetical protein
VSALAGPYGHPVHPILVTVPIGAWVASLGFDIASHIADEADVFAKGAFWLIALGVLAPWSPLSPDTLTVRDPDRHPRLPHRTRSDRSPAHLGAVSPRSATTRAQIGP